MLTACASFSLEPTLSLRSILGPPSLASGFNKPLALSLDGIIRSTILSKERGLGVVVVVRLAPAAVDSARSSFPSDDDDDANLVSSIDLMDVRR